MRKSALLAAAVAVLLLGVLAHADDKTCELNFLVVKADNGKPVRNASVVLHQVDKEGRQSKGGLQLKTDPEGHASYAATPYGKLRVQVLASGFQTYGEDFDIDQPTQEIVVKMKRPQRQYSIYEDKKQDEKPRQEDKPKP